MPRVLFVGNLEEQRGGAEGKILGVDVRRGRETADAAVIEQRELVERDGHIARHGLIRRREHLTRERHCLRKRRAPLEIPLDRLILVGAVGENFIDVEEVELFAGHAQLGVLAVLQHGEDGRRDDGARALLPERVLLVRDGADARDQVAQILVHLVVDALAHDADVLDQLFAIRPRLAAVLVPAVAGEDGTHHLEVGIVLLAVLVNKDALARLDVVLIRVPDRVERVPAVGRIGVAQVEYHDLVAARLQIFAVQVEQLALGVGHHHGRTAGGRADELDHGVDEGRRLAGARRADDQRVDAGKEVDLQMPLFIQHRADGDAVLVRRGEILIVAGREVAVALLVGEEAAVFQRAVHALRLAAEELLDARPLLAEHEIHKRAEHHHADAEPPCADVREVA